MGQVGCGGSNHGERVGPYVPVIKVNVTQPQNQNHNNEPELQSGQSNNNKIKPTVTNGERTIIHNKGKSNQINVTAMNW
jgi:hypothetical protein